MKSLTVFTAITCGVISSGWAGPNGEASTESELIGTLEIEPEPSAPLLPPGFVAATTDTTTIFLWYADGGPPPADAKPCQGKTPPAYTCSFGDSVEDCKEQVQRHLDEWYADFNVVFTLTRPESGPYYTVVVTGDGSWCGQNSSIGGVAPINCQDMEGGTAFAFVCGRHAKTCASIIAQEHAHTVGLAHTKSRVDVMFPSVQSTVEGFEDKENEVDKELCREKQNSHRMMLSRLGKWTGGTKPGPFRSAPIRTPNPRDGGAPDSEPKQDTPDAGSPSPRGPVGWVPPADGEPGTSLPSDDSGGGCQLGGGSSSSTPLALVIALVAIGLRRRRRA